MSKRPTIQDVADRAGVSRSAISKVLRNAYGISDEMRAGADLLVSIAQFGSTRSINVGVAAGIVMHAFVGRLRLQSGRRPSASSAAAYNRELVALLTAGRT